jgi:hypothetical protein
VAVLVTLAGFWIAAQPAAAQDASLVAPPASSDASPALQNAEAAQGTNNAFGLHEQDFWIGATQFMPRSSAGGWNYESFFFYSLAGAGVADAQIQLPAGAHMSEFECFFYDASANNASVAMWKQSYNYSTHTPSNSQIGASVASSGTGGYQEDFTLIDQVIKYRDVNDRPLYTLIAYMPAGDASVRLRACRIFWNRTVSPAPASATFGDVPTSSAYFAYVEALYASGVIAGCGGGNYCPGNPVTRGQLAVFLGASLGLHWPY